MDVDFQAHREHLRAVAHRMLGSAAEAEDAVQEAWLRVDRAGTDRVRDERAWLTTVVARICLDMLRARAARREAPLTAAPAEPDPGPEQDAVLADSVGLALLVVLDALTPAERVTFVLHDLFGVPFAEIARILDRSAPAAKMLASRARRRVRTAKAADSDPVRRRRLVEAFLAASRGGDFAALLDLLDPGVTVRATGQVLRGSAAVARQALSYARRARNAEIGPVDGEPGIVVRAGNRVVIALALTVTGGRITHIEVHTMPYHLP